MTAVVLTLLRILQEERLVSLLTVGQPSSEGLLNHQALLLNPLHAARDQSQFLSTALLQPLQRCHPYGATPGRISAIVLLFGSNLMTSKIYHHSFSSSSMKPSITFRPSYQKLESPASSPNGFKSSKCRFDPPARSISKYFSSKPSALDWYIP